MIEAFRKRFNDSFTEEKYKRFLEKLNGIHPGAIEFRVAETPVFVSKDFERKMIGACESIVDLILDPKFKRMTERSIPEDLRVPGETDRCEMMAFDFGICENENGELEPQLIEMQGFPSLFGFQVCYPEIIGQVFDLPSSLSPFPKGQNKENFLRDFREILLGDHNVENVILLEIKPHEQKTRIDFYCTEDYTGIKPVCITELIREGKDLFYMREGVKTPVYRIYNRVIFDDLIAQKSGLGEFVDITSELNVEWVPHPNWFYRISKFTIPFIHHPFVPETFFLNELKQIPGDLNDYVLKPLFSFAGKGVIIDVEQADLDNISDPENWILQKKVKYAEVIQTPDEPSKAEIRMMYLWKKNEPRPYPAINLARLSKGKMIGVRYNKDKTWVGGSVALFENS